MISCKELTWYLTLSADVGPLRWCVGLRGGLLWFLWILELRHPIHPMCRFMLHDAAIQLGDLKDDLKDDLKVRK